MAKILLLEDDPEFCALLSDSMSRRGHETFVFSNAHDAVDAFSKDAFDVVVTDLIIKDDEQHTNEGGLILIWRVREISAVQKRYVPVIAISGTIHHLGMQHALDTARHLGADHVLPKPFSPNELQRCIEMAISKGSER